MLPLAVPSSPALVCLLLVLATVCGAHSAVDIGLSFNETLAGYFTDGDLPYEEAYEQGKAANRFIQFNSHVVMEHMRDFVSDPQHAAALNGHVLVRGVTGILGTKYAGGTLNLFNGSIFDHQMDMYYYIPFVGRDLQPYHVEGVKHVLGDNCSHFFAMATTLYIHVRRGHVRAQGTIVSSGIVKIDVVQVAQLVASFRLLGNGTDADKVDTITEFASFLLKDVSADCFNVSNWQTQFWYVWASDGRNGFLLDLIARPDTLELRLETYSQGQAPLVTKQYLDIEQLSVSNGNVSFGSQASLSMTSLQGRVKDIVMDVGFALGDKNDFLPPLVVLAFKGLLPQIESYYGTITSGSVGGVSYAPGTPLAHTTYTFEVGLSWLQWAMVSALSFPGTDLQIEVVGMELANRTFLASSYVFFAGQAYHLNDPALSSTSFKQAGTPTNGTREFVVHITQHNKIDITIACAAPQAQFAVLEVEGDTTIHTTVLGACTATEHVSGSSFSTPAALLELKTKTPWEQGI